VQEDAQCAICNNGDYEDEDLIVFCGNCNIPVHQKCYGIDEIPEIDWICNNCLAFNLKRGIQVKCILCPKRGGAMKPTSIFTTHEHFMQYHSVAAKKKGLNHVQHFTSFTKPLGPSDSAQPEDENDNENQDEIAESVAPLSKNKLHFFEREDKNHALS